MSTSTAKPDQTFALSAQEYILLVNGIRARLPLMKDQELANDIDLLLRVALRVDHVNDMAFWLELDLATLVTHGRVGAAGQFVVSPRICDL
jgi:hypothetical protein